MTSVVVNQARWASGQRLSLSLLASVLVHLLAIIVIAALLNELSASGPPRRSPASAIAVAIVPARPIPFAAPPEEPVLAAELPAPVQSPVHEAAPPPPESPATVSVAQTRPDSSSGVEPPTLEPPGEGISTGPVPAGDVAVGALESSERIGTASALRLSQRFPRPVSRPPRLRDSLVVPYPARAARAHREARIAALLIVDAEGKIIETTLFPNDPLFAAAIGEALRGIRLEPAAIESGPLTYWTILEFIFTMRPAAQATERASRE